MKNAFSYIENIRKKIKGKHLLLFLDFDGSLTPIMDSPDEVKLSPDTKKILESFRDNKRCDVVVISGRQLRDLKKRVSVPGLICVGNHGFEAEGPGFDFIEHSAEKCVPLMRRLKAKLSDALKKYKGAEIENKKYSLSVHYRLVKNENIAAVWNAFENVVGAYVSSGKVIMAQGKMVWEVRPPVDWNKGKIVLRILDKMKKKKRGSVLPVYIGDDRTDEDAFLALKDKGCTVKVGRTLGTKSFAKCFVEDTESVSRLLKDILRFIQ